MAVQEKEKVNVRVKRLEKVGEKEKNLIFKYINIILWQTQKIFFFLSLLEEQYVD